MLRIKNLILSKIILIYLLKKIKNSLITLDLLENIKIYRNIFIEQFFIKCDIIMIRGEYFEENIFCCSTF